MAKFSCHGILKKHISITYLMVFFFTYKTVHIQGWIHNTGIMGTGPGAQAHWGGAVSNMAESGTGGTTKKIHTIFI